MKGRLILAIMFAIATIAVFFSINKVNGQPDDTSKVKLGIQVYDVELSSGIAQVNITITFSNLFIEDSYPNESVTAVIMGEADSIRIPCNSTVRGVFSGSSGIISWTLGGELGKGEYTPFEIYELKFNLSNVLSTRVGFLNLSKIDIDRDYNLTYLEGPRRIFLARVFEIADNRFGLKMSFPDHLTAITYLKRKLGPWPFFMPILFWLLIVPTIVCYFLLVSTLLLSGEKAEERRLYVYVSLFFFSPTFLMAIQGYLPLRANLSIPEVLIVNLIISTAIFSISNFLSVKSTIQELTKDGVALFLSSFSSLFLINCLMPLFPTSASPVFLWSIILPYLVIALSVWTVRCEVEFSKPPNDKITRFLGVFGASLIEIGLLLTVLFFNLLVIIVGAVVLTIGACLVLCQRRRQRRIWYWAYGEH